MRWAWMVLGAAVLAGCLGGSATTSSGDTGTTDATSSGTTDGSSASGGASGSGSTGASTGGTTSSTTSGTTGSSGPTDFHRDTPLDGSTVNLLHFAVIGDCRPSSYVNDASLVPSKYPTQIVTNIFQKIVARNPQFALFSGDVLYTYNPPDTTSAAAQIDQFLSARNLMDRPFAPALGNHEDTDSINKPVWSQKFGVLFYYSFTVHTSLGDAVFIVADDTFYDARQMSWIQAQLQKPAALHIVLKHQPTASTDNTDFETAFKQLVAQYPASLILTGHSHTYDRPNPNELVLGTAGAPLANSAPGYGYAMVDQLSNGKLQVTVYTSGSNTQIDQWTTP